VNRGQASSNADRFEGENRKSTYSCSTKQLPEEAEKQP